MRPEGTRAALTRRARPSRGCSLNTGPEAELGAVMWVHSAWGKARPSCGTNSAERGAGIEPAALRHRERGSNPWPSGPATPTR